MVGKRSQVSLVTLSAVFKVFWMSLGRFWGSLGRHWGVHGVPWGVPGLLEGVSGSSLGAFWGSWGAPGGAWGGLFVSGSLWERIPGNSGRFREPFWLHFGMIFDEFS